MSGGLITKVLLYFDICGDFCKTVDEFINIQEKGPAYSSELFVQVLLWSVGYFRRCLLINILNQNA